MITIIIRVLILSLALVNFHSSGIYWTTIETQYFFFYNLASQSFPSTRRGSNRRTCINLAHSSTDGVREHWSGPLGNGEHLFARSLANPNELDNLISSLLALCCLLGTLNGPVGCQSSFSTFLLAPFLSFFPSDPFPSPLSLLTRVSPSILLFYLSLIHSRRSSHHCWYRTWQRSQQTSNKETAFKFARKEVRSFNC